MTGPDRPATAVPVAKHVDERVALSVRKWRERLKDARVALERERRRATSAEQRERAVRRASASNAARAARYQSTANRFRARCLELERENATYRRALARAAKQADSGAKGPAALAVAVAEAERHAAQWAAERQRLLARIHDLSQRVRELEGERPPVADRVLPVSTIEITSHVPR